MTALILKTDSYDKCDQLDHKTSHKSQFFEIEVYRSSERWINKLPIDVRFVMIGQYLADIQLLDFNIFTVGNFLNIIMEHDLYLIS